MPGIQFSAGTYSTPSNAIRLQNFLLTYNAGGPTSQTGYWTQYPRPSNGWVIYINKATQGPSIYVCNNDTDLVNSASQLSNTTITSVDAAINYFNNQTDKIIVGTPLPNIPLDGLQMYLDAGIVQSYNRTGTTWNNLIYGNANGTLVNGPTFSTDGGGSIVFDATDDLCTFPVGTFNSGAPQDGTYYFRIKYPPYPSVQNQLFNESGSVFNNGIVYYRNSNTAANRYFFVNYYNTPTGTASITTGGPNGLLAGQWADTAFTFNSSGGWATYKNGVLDTSGTASNFVSWKRDGTGVPQIKCSSADGAGSQQLFYYYNRELSASEIVQIFNATKDRVGL